MKLTMRPAPPPAPRRASAPASRVFALSGPAPHCWRTSPLHWRRWVVQEPWHKVRWRPPLALLTLYWQSAVFSRDYMQLAEALPKCMRMNACIMGLHSKGDEVQGQVLNTVHEVTSHTCGAAVLLTCGICLVCCATPTVTVRQSLSHVVVQPAVATIDEASGTGVDADGTAGHVAISPTSPRSPSRMITAGAVGHNASDDPMHAAASLESSGDYSMLRSCSCLSCSVLQALQTPESDIGNTTAVLTSLRHPAQCMRRAVHSAHAAHRW